MREQKGAKWAHDLLHTLRGGCRTVSDTEIPRHVFEDIEETHAMICTQRPETKGSGLLQEEDIIRAQDGNFHTYGKMLGESKDAGVGLQLWDAFFLRRFLEKEHLHEGGGVKWIHLELHSLRKGIDCEVLPSAPCHQLVSALTTNCTRPCSL